MALTKEQQQLVEAVYQDARQTWPQVTVRFLQDQAERVLSGQRPQGGPGVFLEDVFRRAGFIQ
jgi:hypothetical protein